LLLLLTLHARCQRAANADAATLIFASLFYTAGVTLRHCRHAIAHSSFYTARRSLLPLLPYMAYAITLLLRAIRYYAVYYTIGCC